MKAAVRQRRLLSPAALAAAGLLFAGIASAQGPAHGRYRCYQPPGYAVIAWFDLDARGLSLNGEPPRPVRVDAAGRIELPPDFLPPWRHGFHFPPGVAGGDAGRVTIVLATRADARPGQRAWAKLPRCYLTTH